MVRPMKKEVERIVRAEKKYNTIATESIDDRKLIHKTLKEHFELMKESSLDRKSMHLLLKAHTVDMVENKQDHLAIKNSIDFLGNELRTGQVSLQSSLTSINNIKFNGNNKVYTVEGAFQEIYTAIKDLDSLTKEIKIKKKFRESFKELRKNTSIGKALSSVVGQALLAFIVIFIVLSLIYAFGVESLNPIKLSGKLLYAIYRIFF
jgi:hypothetical protein